MVEAQTSRRRWLWTVARAAVSGAMLLWVLHSTPLPTITATLRGADWVLLIAGMGINLLTRIAAAERTCIISRALGLPVTRWQTIETLFISNFYALLSPGPVLSGVVTVYRYKGYGASMAGSVGSLLASRAVECAAFIAVGTACVLLDGRVALSSVRYPLSLAMAAILALGAAMTCWGLLHRRWKPSTADGSVLSGTGSGVAGKVRLMWHEIMTRGPQMLWRASLVAAMQVILSGAAVSLLAASLGINLSLLTATWLSAAVYAVVLLPISVAGLGVREVTLVKALALLGVSPQLAVALSVLMFVDPLINAVIGGLWQLGSSLRRL